MVIFYFVLMIFAISGWVLEMRLRKKIEEVNKAYGVFIEIFKKDRDKWKAIAQGQREGDEWKDG